MREGRDAARQRRERARRYEREDSRRYDSRSSRRRKRRKSSKLPLIIAVLVVAAIAAVLFVNALAEEFGYSREHQDLNAYFGITSEDQAVIISDKEVLDAAPVIQGDAVYIPMSLANTYYDNFYYDSREGHLLVTGATRTVEGVQGSDYLVNEEAYVSLAFLNRFVPMEYRIYKDPMRVEINTGSEAVTTDSLESDAKMRVSADKKSPILMDLESGDMVELEEKGESWSKIRIQAVEGYIESKALSGKETQAVPALSGGAEADDSYQKLLRPHKIVLGFHNVAVADANSYLKEAVANTRGMNVIAPTWFAIADNEGHLTDIGSASYVSAAHEMGCEVWGVADNFTNQIDTNEVLSRTSSRLTLEQELIGRATELGLDGINIDFEQLAGETGDDLAQFLRELSILTRAAGLVLSVDNYVPQDYTDFYRRDIQGRVADYVVIMGYDEHTAASAEAGSVASIGFVTKGIEDTLEEVPAAQVINAIPFYTRKWSYENGSLSCESLGMSDARAFLADKGVQPAWDAETCQNYASFERDGVIYSIWLEDAQSISSKLTVMTAHDLGGVGCWKLTQETPDIWDTITTFYPPGQ
ncbi:MAG: chitinase [Lachnospiraceae bacterium]|nr:chitinase [Lachnospiraceae bacterium]